MARLFPKLVNVGLTSTQVFGPNPRRRAIILSPPSANRYSVAFGEDAVLDRGITMEPNSSPLALLDETCGFDLTGSLTAIANVATDVAFTEASNP